MIVVSGKLKPVFIKEIGLKDGHIGHFIRKKTTKKKHRCGLTRGVIVVSG